MRITTAILIATLSGLIYAAPAVAQELKLGTLSGTVMSFGLSVPAGTTVAALTVPADKSFVVTQVCLALVTDFTLNGSVFGTAPLCELTGGGKYSPGIAFAPGESVTFTNSSAHAATVVINGVLVKP
jgi:hypothetical protein